MTGETSRPAPPHITVFLNFPIRYGPDRTGSYFPASPAPTHDGRVAISACQSGWWKKAMD